MCEPIYINEVLEEACALVSFAARAKNIAIVRELSEGWVTLGTRPSFINCF